MQWFPNMDLSEFPSCWTHGKMCFKSVGWGFLKEPQLRESYRAVRLKDARRQYTQTKDTRPLPPRLEVGG